MGKGERGKGPERPFASAFVYENVLHANEVVLLDCARCLHII